MSKKITQTAGRAQLGEFAPMFAHLNDDVLFGEVWNEETIDIKTKCIIVNFFTASMLCCRRMRSPSPVTIASKSSSLICDCTLENATDMTRCCCSGERWA